MLWNLCNNITWISVPICSRVALELLDSIVNTRMFEESKKLAITGNQTQDPWLELPCSTLTTELQLQDNCMYLPSTTPGSHPVCMCQHLGIIRNRPKLLQEKSHACWGHYILMEINFQLTQNLMWYKLGGCLVFNKKHSVPPVQYISRIVMVTQWSEHWQLKPRLWVQLILAFDGFLLSSNKLTDLFVS